MTLKLRLDTAGLRALIAENPELELEIGREVMNNIKADNIATGVAAQITECLNSMVKRTGYYNDRKIVAKAPELVAAIRAEVDRVVAESLGAMIYERVEVASRMAQAALVKEFRGCFADMVTPEMARDILREKILL